MFYFISEKDLNNQILNPRIPKNFFTENGYEDNITPRVCFSDSIEGCLKAMACNIMNKEYFIYVPNENYNFYKPNITEVPDCEITNEVWCKKPIKVKCIGKIKIINSYGDGIPYKYGNEIGELYEWEYRWIDRK